MVPSALRDCSTYQFRRVTFRLGASLSVLDFHIKKPLPVLLLAADWNVAYGNRQLFHGQASYGEANYNAGNYYFFMDDHTNSTIK